MALPFECEKAFTEIYRNNAWHFGSGHGSLEGPSRAYREFVQSFLAAHPEIKTVVDCGCGDGQVFSRINWTGVNYIGMDCVRPLIEHNRATWPQHTWVHLDMASQPEDIPRADLYLVKEVFQHLSNAAVRRVMDELISRDGLILLANNNNQQNDDDTVVGGWRPLIGTREPLLRYSTELMTHYDTSPGHTQNVYLVRPKPKTDPRLS